MTNWQKAKNEAQYHIDKIQQWRCVDLGEDIDRMRTAIACIAQKHHVPYNILRKQTLWEPVWIPKNYERTKRTHDYN